MDFISIDIETFSSYDLRKCGVYKYTEADDFEILLFGYSVDGGAVNVADLASGDTIPDEIIDALTDDSVLKWAFNANFERICLSRYLLKSGYLNPESWRCSMVWCAYTGFPLSLESAGAVLGLEKQKLAEGRALIRYFCSPCKPTAANGQHTRNLPEYAPDRWELFKMYNRADVEAEMSVQKKLANFPVPEFIWDEYALDQKINDRGVMLDMTLVRNAIKADRHSETELIRQMKKITSLDNPNSVTQMRQWLCDNGAETDTLDKKAVALLLKTAPETPGKALELWQQLAKISTKKYQAMENAVCSDGRVRGMFQFYGARTGRWAGRLIQLQNLPQNRIPDLAQARALVRSGNTAALELLYDNIPDVLSQLIRTAFVPKNGCVLAVADFSAIEARVIAWLAREQWRNEVFATHGKIYEASASAMFGVPIESVTKGSALRQKGKIAELALGYGGSVGALKAMGALEMGLEEDELQPLVTAWRSANPNIVRLWWDVDRAAMTAVRDKTAAETNGIGFVYQSGILFISLPSGRKLSYVKPRIGTNQFGSDCVTYEGVGVTKKWERLESYGPKFTENIVQAISRDILSYAMQEAQNNIVMHVHDELVVEADSSLSVKSLCKRMSRVPAWAEGLQLTADGFECLYYKKD